jgi:histidyl-tRNA synthetase
MVNEKHLPGDIADQIGEYVRQSGKVDLVEKLMEDSKLVEKSKSAKEGLEAMKLFLRYIDLYDLTQYVVFDLSLARGLDYYTGVIYEAILLGNYFLDSYS